MPVVFVSLVGGMIVMGVEAIAGIAVIAHGDDALVGGFADGVLELDGGVADAEALTQLFVDGAEDDVALGSGHIGDLDVG